MKKQIWKLASLFAAVLALSLCFAGCSSAEDDDDDGGSGSDFSSVKDELVGKYWVVCTDVKNYKYVDNTLVPVDGNYYSNIKAYAYFKDESTAEFYSWDSDSKSFKKDSHSDTYSSWKLEDPYGVVYLRIGGAAGFYGTYVKGVSSSEATTVDSVDNFSANGSGHVELDSCNAYGFYYYGATAPTEQYPTVKSN